MKRTSMAQALSQAAGHAFSRPPQPAKPSLDQDKTMQDLLQEALNDLFRKYDLPPIA
jgi:hypothetical protein